MMKTEAHIIIADQHSIIVLAVICKIARLVSVDSRRNPTHIRILTSEEYHALPIYSADFVTDIDSSRRNTACYIHSTAIKVAYSPPLTRNIFLPPYNPIFVHVTLLPLEYTVFTSLLSEPAEECWYRKAIHFASCSGRQMRPSK